MGLEIKENILFAIREFALPAVKKWKVGDREFTSYDKAKEYVEREKEKLQEKENAKKLLQIKSFDDHSLCENCLEYSMFLFKSTNDLKETENALIAYSRFFNILPSAISEAMENTAAKPLIDPNTIYIGILKSDDYGSYFSFKKLSDEIKTREMDVKTFKDFQLDFK